MQGKVLRVCGLARVEVSGFRGRVQGAFEAVHLSFLSAYARCPFPRSLKQVWGLGFRA